MSEQMMIPLGILAEIISVVIAMTILLVNLRRDAKARAKSESERAAETATLQAEVSQNTRAIDRLGTRQEGTLEMYAALIAKQTRLEGSLDAAWRSLDEMKSKSRKGVRR